MDWKKVLAIGIPVLTLLAITLQLYHTQKQIELSNKEEDESFKSINLGIQRPKNYSKVRLTISSFKLIV